MLLHSRKHSANSPSWLRAFNGQKISASLRPLTRLYAGILESISVKKFMMNSRRTYWLSYMIKVFLDIFIPRKYEKFESNSQHSRYSLEKLQVISKILTELFEFQENIIPILNYESRLIDDVVRTIEFSIIDIFFNNRWYNEFVIYFSLFMKARLLCVTSF